MLKAPDTKTVMIFQEDRLTRKLERYGKYRTFMIALKGAKTKRKRVKRFVVGLEGRKKNDTTANFLRGSQRDVLLFTYTLCRCDICSLLSRSRIRLAASSRLLPLSNRSLRSKLHNLGIRCYGRSKTARLLLALQL